MRITPSSNTPPSPSSGSPLPPPRFRLFVMQASLLEQLARLVPQK